MIEPALVHEFRGYLAVVHKRRTLVASCVIVSLIVAVLYNYTTRPLYQATTVLLIERDSPSVLPKEILALPQVTSDYLATQYQLLVGRELAERVVEKLDLQKSEEFRTGPLVSPWERIQHTLFHRNPELTVDTDGMPLSPAVAAFRSRLRVEPIPGSRLFNLRFTAYSGKLAAEAVNALAKAYIEEALESRYATSSETSGWLTDRIAEEQAKLNVAEKALQEYREREGLAVNDERQELSSSQISATNSALITARNQRIAKESLLAQLRALPPGQAASSFATNTPTIAALRMQQLELEREQARLSESLGAKHPDMVRINERLRSLDDKIAAEVEGTMRLLESEVRTAREQEANLKVSLEGGKRESIETTRKSAQQGSLKREVEAHQELIRTLLNRSTQSGVEVEYKYTNIRIIEKAEQPRAPLWPNRSRNYEMGLLIGLALGVGLCVLFEHLDNTFKTPDDVKQHLGLPFLGMVPDVSQRGRGPTAPRPSPLILRSPKSSVAEAYRVLRTNLIFSTADRTGHVLAISSANPGEGKTTTVANLAASLAINGSRVLAVDADLRRPTMHQHFGLAKTPGLSDLIVGKCRPSEAIHKTQFGGLQVLPCGYVPPNPTELLGSASLREIIAALRTHYDWILIDTPPVLAMADTAVLCPLVDGVALVVGAEQSTRPAVQRSVDQIKSVNGRMLGVILNKVNFERNSYYYGQYYGEYYRSYYAEKQEESRPGKAGGARPLRRM